MININEISMNRINDTSQNISSQESFGLNKFQLSNLTFEINSSFPEDMVLYRKKLRGKGRKVFDVIYSFRKKSLFSKTLKDIALAAGCALITAWRWTERFEADGIIKKYQPAIKRANRYSINPALKKHTYKLLCDDMTPEQQYNFEQFYIFPFRRSKNVFSLQSDKQTKIVSINNKALNVGARARVREGAFFNPKGLKVNEVVPVMPASLDSFKSLKLTLAGKIRLSIFRDDVIALADKRLAQHPNKANPMAYVMRICDAVSKERGIPLNLSLREALYKLHGISKSDNSIEYDKHAFEESRVLSLSKAQSPVVVDGEINESNFDPRFYKRLKDKDGNVFFEKRSGSTALHESEKAQALSDEELLRKKYNVLGRLPVNGLDFFQEIMRNDLLKEIDEIARRLDEKVVELIKKEHI